MKIAQRHARTQTVDLHQWSFTKLEYGYGGGTASLTLEIDYTSAKAVCDALKDSGSSSAQLVFTQKAVKGNALKWDGTTKGLTIISKALGVAFLLAFDDSTGETIHFVVKGSERLQLCPGDYVAAMDDESVEVLSHSDITANYDIGDCCEP